MKTPGQVVKKLMMPPINHVTYSKVQKKEMQKRYLDGLQKHLDKAQDHLDYAQKEVAKGRDLHEVHKELGQKMVKEHQEAMKKMTIAQIIPGTTPQKPQQ
jgi:hypothetical protein